MRVMLVLAAALALVACGIVPVRQVVEGEPLSLGPEEGLLALHVESDVVLSSIGFSQLWVDVPPDGDTPHIESAHVGVWPFSVAGVGRGTQLRILALPEGVYRWTQILRGSGYYFIGSGSRWTFVVRPGRINYPGQLIVRDVGSQQLWIQWKPRVGTVLRALHQHYPSLLETHSLLYAGVGDDPYPAAFLERLEVLTASEAEAADRQSP